MPKSPPEPSQGPVDLAPYPRPLASLIKPPAPSPLWRHPSGVFFGLSAAIAVLLPWLWLLPLEDPRMAHLRLGLFGFAGAAVVGYVLTARPAWTARHPPVPLAGLAALFLVARAAGIVWPWQPWPALAPQLALGLAVLWPVLAGRVWHKAALAAVPLMLALAEAGLSTGLVPVEAAPIAMAGLVLLVGGRAVPAFLASEATRQGRSLPRPAPLWPAPLALALAWAWPVLAPLALLPLIGVILLRLRGATRAGVANRMLAGSWALLIPGLGLLLLAPEGAGRIVAEHVVMTGAIGCTILAFAARVTMRRAGDGLRPRRVHLLAFALVLLAVPLRAWAGLPAAPLAWMTAAGVVWSAGWALILITHLAALPRPAPFPVLSATRSRQATA